MKKLAVIVLNYRRAALTIDCLRSLAPEIESHDNRCAVVVDNASDDGSADAIEAAISENNWKRWITLIRSSINTGFAGGNNIGIRAVQAEYYMLLNSDARVLPDSTDKLLSLMERNPDIGAVGPQLQYQDGELQCSCFRYRTPLTEFLAAAGTGPLDRLFNHLLVAMGVFENPIEPQWLSFACIMIRGAVINQIGLMDEQYFMYFEDIDYSRQIRAAGWRIVHLPSARVIHLRGGTSSVKSAMRSGARVPRYYYESRSRYFAKFYGGVVGLWFTNFLWGCGRLIGWARVLFGKSPVIACRREARDNWTNWLSPLRAPQPQRGGDL